jgi:hypothetical protein
MLHCVLPSKVQYFIRNYGNTTTRTVRVRVHVHVLSYESIYLRIKIVLFSKVYSNRIRVHVRVLSKVLSYFRTKVLSYFRTSVPS